MLLKDEAEILAAKIRASFIRQAVHIYVVNKDAAFGGMIHRSHDREQRAFA
jgi:hypothetical protein